MMKTVRAAQRYRISSSTKAEIRQLRARGLRAKEIAAQVGWSESSVWNALAPHRETNEWGQWLVHRGAGL